MDDHKVIKTKYKIIATLGPSSNTREKILELKKAGVDIFRVNMSHSSIQDLKKISKICNENNIRLGLDTEGAQIRTYLLNKDFIELKIGENLRIYQDEKRNQNQKTLYLYPKGVTQNLKEGDIVRLDFNGALIVVNKKEGDYLDCECICGGTIGNNKGVDILNNSIYLEDFTEKDLECFKKLDELNIKDVFISFCKSKKAVLFLKEQYPSIRVISKIESKSSINNLYGICEASDALLIDRGDLTREINILDIPFAQRGIIKVANSFKKPCYVATNVFESLINGNLPTRAELNDVVGTLEMGASGIVLAAETAIGNKPLLSVEIVKELVHRFNLFKDGLLFVDLERNEIGDPEMKLWLNRNKKI